MGRLHVDQLLDDGPEATEPMEVAPEPPTANPPEPAARVGSPAAREDGTPPPRPGGLADVSRSSYQRVYPIGQHHQN